MGCASSSSAAAPVASLGSTVAAVDPKPVSEAASAPARASERVTADAVVSFTASVPLQPKQSIKQSSKNEEAADLAEVDRLLRMSNSDLKAQPLALRAEEVPSTPPLLSRTSGTAYGVSDNRGQQGGASSATSSPQRQSVVVPKLLDSFARPPAVSEEEVDPWASLQSKYKIGEGAAGAAHAPPAVPKRRSKYDDDEEDDVVMLDGGPSEGSLGKPAGGGYATPSAVRLAARAPPVGAAARAGGWGNGDLAAAGTLMLGSEQPVPRVAAAPPGMSREYEDAMDELDEPSSARVRATGGGDLGIEDMEDLDAMLAEEMQTAGLNGDLASKLARFEAMNDFDD